MKSQPKKRCYRPENHHATAPAAATSSSMGVIDKGAVLHTPYQPSQSCQRNFHFCNELTVRLREVRIGGPPLLPHGCLQHVIGTVQPRAAAVVDGFELILRSHQSLGLLGLVALEGGRKGALAPFCPQLYVWWVRRSAMPLQLLLKLAVLLYRMLGHHQGQVVHSLPGNLPQLLRSWCRLLNAWLSKPAACALRSGDTWFR